MQGDGWRSRKLWFHILMAVGLALVNLGHIDAAQAESLVTLIVDVLAGLGILVSYTVGNVAEKKHLVRLREQELEIQRLAHMGGIPSSPPVAPEEKSALQELIGLAVDVKEIPNTVIERVRGLLGKIF